MKERSLLRQLYATRITGVWMPGVTRGRMHISIDRIISAATARKIQECQKKRAGLLLWSGIRDLYRCPRDVAVIEFRGIAAEEVSREQASLAGILSITTALHAQNPYSDSRELVMDILKWGEMAEVKGPESLREEVRRVVREMGRRYGITECGTRRLEEKQGESQVLRLKECKLRFVYELLRL